MKYITKQLHRLEMFESKHPFFVHKKVFFPPHVLCIKRTFPASASRAAIGVPQLNQEGRKKKKRSRKGINELKPVDLF